MKQLKMNISGAGGTISDGAHRHSREQTTINISDESLLLVSNHLPVCKGRPDSFDANTKVPLQFVIEQSGKSSVICGYCKKNLGECNIKEAK